MKPDESLEPGRDEAVDELWLDEAERRLREFDREGTQARDAEAAISEIERQLTCTCGSTEVERR